MKMIENKFWQLLEVNPGRIATLPDWKRATEFDLFHAMVQPVEGYAATVTDPKNPDGRRLKVVEYPDGHFGAIDSTGERRVPLTLDEVIRYTFKLNEFRTLLSRVLDFEPVADAVPPKSLTPMRFGMLRVKPGTEFPVYLILAPDCRVMDDQLRSLLVDENDPFWLLTATRRTWTQEMSRRLGDRRSHMVALEECLGVENGRIVKTETWDNAVSAFRSMHFPEDLVAAPPPFEFRKKGDMWVIRFEGEDMYLKDSVGLRCIGRLLAKPNDPVFVMELRAIMDSQNPEAITQPPSREDAVDQSTLADLKRRYLELQSDLEEAQRDGNEMVEKETELEMEKIVQYLCQVKARGGETRKVSDDFEKARSATSKAFWRAVNQIRTDLPQLATHLEKSCVVGMVCNYAPERAVDWVL